jgi:hypothetical protein
MFEALLTNDNPGGRVGTDVGCFKVKEGATNRIRVIGSFLKKVYALLLNDAPDPSKNRPGLILTVLLEVKMEDPLTDWRTKFSVVPAVRLLDVSVIAKV